MRSKGIITSMAPKRRRDLLLTCVALIAIFMGLYFIKNGGVVGTYEIRVLNMCAIYAILGLSMNLVNGFTGLFSLGQAGFMAIGAYATSLLFMPTASKTMIFYLQPLVPWLAHIQWPFPVALFTGGLVAALAAFLIGFPVLRLKGDYLAIATLGFSEIIRVIFVNAQTVTNGSVGLTNIPPTANLWWNFGCMALVIAFILRLMRTSYGRAFKAIRDNEIAAESMGVSLFRHKMWSFVLSGFIAGMGGGLMASVVGSINPNLFKFILAYDILLIVVLGGMGSVSGTIVSAFIITIAKEWLRFLDSGFHIGPIHVPEIAGLRMVVFSALLMFVILFYRQGMFGNREFSWQGMLELIRRPFTRKGGARG